MYIIELIQFFKASKYLYTVVETIYPTTNSSPGGFRKRSIYAPGRGDRGSGRGICFNVQGRGRGHGIRDGQGRGGHDKGGRGVGSDVYENGIEISDVTY